MNGDYSASSAGASTSAFAQIQHSNRASPYPPSSSVAAANTTLEAMATTGFLPQPQTLRSLQPGPSSYPLGMSTIQRLEREANQPRTNASFARTSPSSMVRVLIRRLPLNTTEESLQSMVVWSKDLADVEVLPIEHSEDSGFCSAMLRFHTMAGAMEVKNMLDGRANISKDAEMIVEVLSSSPISSRRFATEPTSANPSSTASSATSSAAGSRQAPRFNGAFQSLENISSPTNSAYPLHDFPDPDASVHYQSLFSPKSPIGNYVAEHHPRISGKTLIASDSLDDDETTDLLKDPVAYAENGATAQRRATAPQIPIGRMAGLSLNTNNPQPGSSSLPPFLNALSAHPSSMSPLNGSSPGVNYPMPNPPYQRHNFPPVNPADQNPPCNTLYVGNLPIDTSEEELKAMFSKQRGYKRLCFRTKQNGPMCFVEFEDVSFATKALHELYGQPLHNSVKGGIRLSFSKNPLGVRSGQTPGQGNGGHLNGINGIVAGSSHGFTTANGPPPGLAAPPGLGSGRGAYNGSTAMNSSQGSHYAVHNFSNNPNNGWTGPTYGGAVATGSNGPTPSQPPAFLPPHMMGR